MKKHMKLVATVATLLIAAAGVITFEACNKKNEVTNNIPELNVVELSDMDKEMILFGEKMKAAQKGGETMQLEEAIRNLSNYENFKMCDASRYSTDMERLTIESIIPVTEGNVYLSDINAIYESNKKQIKDKLASIESDDKTVYCIFSRIDENSKDGENARVVTDAIILRGLGLDIPSPYYFDEEQCWQGVYGYCNSCTGGNAVDVLSDRLNQISIVGYVCMPGYTTYFYDHVDTCLYAEDFPDPNSPNGQYGLIHDDYEPLCLYADDMRYYLNNMVNVVTAWNAEQLLNEKVLSFIMYVDFNNSLLWGTYSNVGCTHVGFDD